MGQKLEELFPESHPIITEFVIPSGRGNLTVVRACGNSPERVPKVGDLRIEF